MKRALLSALLLALFPGTAHAAFPAPSLTIDQAFAPLTGIAKDDFSADIGSDIPADVVAVGGRIYTVGSATLNNDSSVAVIAHRADGTLDPGFDGDGKLFLPLAPGTEGDRAFSVVALPDGRLRIAAQVDVDASTSTNLDVAIVGLLPDGQLDPGFGDNGSGKVVFGVGSGDDSPDRMAIDAQGRLAVAGYTNNGGNVRDTFVSLRNPDGSPAAFGVNGVRVIFGSPSGQYDEGADVAFRAGGGLALLMKVDSASSGCASGETAVIRGLQADGADDLAFGSGGQVPLNVGDPATCAGGLIEHGGWLWATGITHTGVEQDAFLARVRADGTGLESRRFQMLGKSASTESVKSGGADLTLLAGPPETLVVVGSTILSSGGVGQFAAAAFNNLDGDLAAASYGDFVSTAGSDQTGLVDVAPEGPYAAVAAGLLFASNGDTSFATTRLVVDSDKKCDAAMDVPAPLELTFIGRKAASATIAVTNKGQKSCPAAAVGLAAPYKLGRAVTTPVLGPGESFTASNVPITTSLIRRDDDVAKFSVSIPGDGDTSNDLRGVRVVFSFCDLGLSAVEKPSTVPSEGWRRVEVGLANKGTTTCRRVGMKVSGGTGGGASKPYSIDRGRSVSDDVNLGVKRGTKVGRKVTLRVRTTSFDDDVVSSNDSIKLTARVVGVGDTRVSRAGASTISGTAKNGKAGAKQDRKGVRLAKAEVAVRRLGRGCRWLSGKKAHFTTRKLAKGAACTPRGWQAASGKRSWRLSMRLLPAGRYVVYSRAVTRNGFREANFAASDRNKVTFRVGLP